MDIRITLRGPYMFLNRLNAPDRRISSIEGHLRAIEKEMARMGMTAGGEPRVGPLRQEATLAT